MEIVFLDRSTFPAPLRRPQFAHEWVDHALSTAAQVGQRLRHATIAVTNKTPVDEEVLALAPQLKLVAVIATGVDCVDLEACRARGVAVTNVPHYADRAVAEHALTLMLAVRRRLVSYQVAARDGTWSQSQSFALTHLPVADLAGAALGIIGVGGVGQQVAALGQAFGMTVLLAERRGVATAEIRGGRTSFEEVLRRADVLSLHAPLTAETRGLIGAAELKQLKPNSILINTARGGLVDEPALANALRSGKLFGAGLDVLSQEPPPADHVLLAADLVGGELSDNAAYGLVESGSIGQPGRGFDAQFGSVYSRANPQSSGVNTVSGQKKSHLNDRWPFALIERLTTKPWAESCHRRSWCLRCQHRASGCFRSRYPKV